MFTAVGKNHCEVVQLLLAKATKLNLVNDLKQCAAVIAVRSNNYEISKMVLDSHKDDVDVLYRMDHKNRTLLDQCIKFRVRKDIVNYVKKLLHRSVHEVIKVINSSEDHKDLPYLPNGIVQSICNMTY